MPRRHNRLYETQTPRRDDRPRRKRKNRTAEWDNNLAFGCIAMIAIYFLYTALSGYIVTQNIAAMVERWGAVVG